MKRAKIFIVALAIFVMCFQGSSVIGATHSCTGVCYPGTIHAHTSCPYTNKTCTNGCARHTHSTSKCSYTTHYHSSSYGCYDECPGTYSISSGSNSAGNNTCNCGVSYTYYYYTCDVCGDETYYIGICSTCGYGGGGTRYKAACNSRELVCGYSEGTNYTCGYDTSKYYKNNSLCTVCEGDRVMKNYTCGKTAGTYYSSAGVVVSNICNKVVTDLTPLE